MITSASKVARPGFGIGFPTARTARCANGSNQCMAAVESRKTVSKHKLGVCQPRLNLAMELFGPFLRSLPLVRGVGDFVSHREQYLRAGKRGLNSQGVGNTRLPVKEVVVVVPNNVVATGPPLWRRAHFVVEATRGTPLDSSCHPQSTKGAFHWRAVLEACARKRQAHPDGLRSNQWRITMLARAMKKLKSSCYS